MMMKIITISINTTGCFKLNLNIILLKQVYIYIYIYIYIYTHIHSELSKAVRIFIEIVTTKYPSSDQGKVYLWKPQTEKGSVNFCCQFYAGITQT